MTENIQNRKLRLKNVASVEELDNSFLYDCKVNSHDYICELDTAASDIFLSLSAAQEMKLPISSGGQNIQLGDGISVKTPGTTKATIKVGHIYSEEEVHLLAGKDTGVLILGRSWGKKHQPELNWKDYSICRTKEDGTKVRILPRMVQTENLSTMKRMSFKKMAREIRKGNCELYMARVVNTGPNADRENIASAR